MNNVFGFFSKFHPQTNDVGQIKAFQRELGAQRELMLLLIKILRDVPELNKSEDVDAQTKILSHMYYVLDRRNRESMMDFLMDMLLCSLGLDENGEILYVEDTIKESEQLEEAKEKEGEGSAKKTEEESKELEEAKEKEGEGSAKQSEEEKEVAGSKKSGEEGEGFGSDFETRVDEAAERLKIYTDFRRGIRQDMNQIIFTDMYFLLDYEFNISRPLHEIELEEEKDNQSDFEDEKEEDAVNFTADPDLEDDELVSEKDLAREPLTRKINDYMVNTFSSLAEISKILDRKLILSRNELHNTDLNRIVRGSLRLLHYIKHQPEEVDKKTQTVARILEFLRVLMEQFFDQIHRYPKIEKMILEVLIKFRQATPVKSNPLAGVFLQILNKQPSFKLSSLVDKFLYMGLFGSYFDAAKKVSRTKINEESLMLESVKTPRDYKLPTFDVALVQDTLLLLDMDLSVENEIIALKFLKKLIRLDSSKIYCAEVCPPENILKKIFVGAGALLKKREDGWTEPQFMLLKRRLRMAKLSLHWLRPENFEERQGQKKKSKKKSKMFEEAPVDPFGTINQLSYGYR